MNPVRPLKIYVGLYIKTAIMHILSYNGLAGFSIKGFGGLTG